MSDVPLINDFVNKYRFLSSYSVSPIIVTVDYLLVPTFYAAFLTVEHAIQARKTADFNSHELIRLCDSPGKAKKLAHQITYVDNWKELREPHMLRLTQLKFPLWRVDGVCHVYPLTAALLTTYPIEIIYDNIFGDTYWGVYNSIGSNRLGKILMQHRKAQHDTLQQLIAEGVRINYVQGG